MIVIEPPDLLQSTRGLALRDLGTGLLARSEALLSERALGRFLVLAIKSAGLEGKVSVLLTDDAAIRRLNRAFRKKNFPTDVLSFPAAPVPVATGAGKQRKLAGDLAISIETAARQAEQCGHSLELEVKILLLHGILHLAGLDHETDDGEMERRENDLRKQLGLPPGLIVRSTGRTSGRTKSRSNGATDHRSKGADMLRRNEPDPQRRNGPDTPRNSGPDTPRNNGPDTGQRHSPREARKSLLEQSAGKSPSPSARSSQP